MISAPRLAGPGDGHPLDPPPGCILEVLSLILELTFEILGYVFSILMPSSPKLKYIGPNLGRLGCVLASSWAPWGAKNAALIKVFAHCSNRATFR